jgi:HSP20 family molecular chaperone IbpA
MRTYDFSPLFRSTVGFDRLFDMLDHARPDWPPYNIERKGDDQYLISMAIAGFGPSEIELVQEGNVLSVTGQKNAGQENRKCCIKVRPQIYLPAIAGRLCGEREMNKRVERLPQAFKGLFSYIVG